MYISYIFKCVKRKAVLCISDHMCVISPSNLYFQVIRDTEFLSFYFSRKSKDNLNLLCFSNSCQA